MRMRPPALSKLAAAAVIATVLALAGCESGGGAASNAAAVPRAGGTLRFAVSSDAGCVDPQQVGSNDSIYAARQLVDSLTDQDPSTGRIVPWLATSWEVGGNGTTFTFHLRPGVTFSDGSRLDARAVKANFDAIAGLGARASLAKGYLTGYQGTTVVDDLTAKVAFAHPNAQFLQATSTFSLGLVSPSTVARSADQRCAGVVGSGPFVLDRYVPNQSITLSRRRGYAWGSSLWRHQGEAYLDKVTFTIIPESGVRAGSLQSGQVDAIGSVGPQDERALANGDARLQARPNPGVVFNIGLNHSRPLFADAKVRQAISLAINRREVVDTTFTKETKPATSILASTTPGYQDLSARLVFDPAQARALLDADGWRVGPDGVRQKNGERLSFTITWFANAATNKPALQLIQQQLRSVGIAVALDEQPISNVVQIQQSAKFDALWGNLTRADPDILRTQYSSRLVNVYHLPAGELDALLDGQAATTDPARRAQLVAAAQQRIVDDNLVIPVVELTTVLGVAKKVHNLDFEASSRIQLHDTWKS